MGSAELDRLVRTGQLKIEAPAKAELATLLHSGEARLRDASNRSLSIVEPLRSRVQRSPRPVTRTVGLPSEQWRVLDDAHRKRNAVEYEGVVDIDDQLVEAMLRVATEIEKRVRKVIA